MHPTAAQTSVVDVDQHDGCELQLCDNESFRTSWQFCWWDLGQTQGTAGNPAEHIGLLALEIAHTAPVACATVAICAFASPDVGCDAEIEPFMIAEHWDHLQRHPHVHEIKIKVCVATRRSHTRRPGLGAAGAALLALLVPIAEF